MPRQAYYGRPSIQPYPYPAYSRPYPRRPYPGYGGGYRQPSPRYGYGGYGGRRGGSISVYGPYGAESRSAYYGPYGSVRSGRSARFY